MIGGHEDGRTGPGWTSASGNLWNVSTTTTTTAKSCDQNRGEKEKERGEERGLESNADNINYM